MLIRARAHALCHLAVTLGLYFLFTICTYFKIIALQCEYLKSVRNLKLNYIIRVTILTFNLFSDFLKFDVLAISLCVLTYLQDNFLCNHDKEAIGASLSSPQTPHLHQNQLSDS